MEAQGSQFTHGNAHVSWLLANSPLYGHLFSDIQLISASPETVTCSLKLKPEHVNSQGSLHGSVTATLVDFMGGLAIACFDGRNNTGVSTDIHVSYTSGARVGEMIWIQGKVDKMGKTLAYTRVEVSRIKDDDAKIMVATGSHTKFVGR